MVFSMYQTLLITGFKSFELMGHLFVSSEKKGSMNSKTPTGLFSDRRIVIYTSQIMRIIGFKYLTHMDILFYRFLRQDTKDLEAINLLDWHLDQIIFYMSLTIVIVEFKSFESLLFLSSRAISNMLATFSMERTKIAQLQSF